MLDACGVILDTNRRPQRPSQSLAEMSSSSCGEVVKRHVKVHVDDDGDYVWSFIIIRCFARPTENLRQTTFLQGWGGQSCM